MQFYNVFWNFFLKLCSFFKRFLFLQKFSILHLHLLSFQMKFNTPYVLPNFGIQSIIFQNFQVFSKHLYLLLLKSILSKIFAAILLCFLKKVKFFNFSYCFILSFLSLFLKKDLICFHLLECYKHSVLNQNSQ